MSTYAYIFAKQAVKCLKTPKQRKNQPFTPARMKKSIYQQE
jgi:hypothetical protein